LRTNILFALFLFCSLPLAGQTPNDNMASAEELILNQFVNSKTHGNTVEARCVDEKLTGKCIDYHNDQWYTFHNDSLRTFYINISGQECRDLRGVQLVVLTGELCNPSTYTIYDCVSLATQDDIFVEIKHLEPNQQYWLNVDGYLHDYCSFFIEVSDKPKGLSAQKYDVLESASENALNVINLQWTIPDSLAGKAKYMMIKRRPMRAFRFDSIGYEPVQYNAYGSMMPTYQYSDTLLLPGEYIYRLGLTLEYGKKLFIADYSIDVPSAYNQTANQIMMTLPLDYENHSPLQLLFINPENGMVMDQLNISFDPKKHSRFSFYVNKYRDHGLKYLEVRVINEKNGDIHPHYLKL